MQIGDTNNSNVKSDLIPGDITSRQENAIEKGAADHMRRSK
jgi:hypothetical protein